MRIKRNRVLPTAYRETAYRLGGLRLTLQLPAIGTDAHRARHEVLVGLVRYLSTEPQVVALLAADEEKAVAFLGGVAEVVAGATEPAFWGRETETVIAELLRQGARRGKMGLYLGSAGNAMTATLG